MPCVKQIRIPTVKAPTQKVAVLKEGEERPPGIERRATLSDEKRKGNRSVRISLHKERNHSHRSRVSFMETSYFGTLSCANVMARRLGQGSQLGKFLFPSTCSTRPIIMCRRHQK